jgi:hypothetical protein
LKSLVSCLSISVIVHALLLAFTEPSPNYLGATANAVRLEARIKTPQEDERPQKQEYLLGENLEPTQPIVHKDQHERSRLSPTEALVAAPIAATKSIRYFVANELNRRPVLVGTIPPLASETSLAALGVSGEANAKVFLSASGTVDFVIFEENNLPASITTEAREALSKTKYLPGYLLGNPVPSVIRWHLVLAPGIRTFLPKKVEDESTNQKK